MELARLYRGKRLKGVIKHRPEDFIVEEMPKRHEVLEINGNYEFDPNTEGKFLHCVMVKKGLDTFEAVDYIRRKLKLKENAITFAGLKDKHALTSQLISIYKGSAEKVGSISNEKIKLYPTKMGNKVFLGALWGNRFTITIRNIEEDETTIIKVLKDWEESTNHYFPNYYGEQRFGTVRSITHEVGKLIILREYEKAVLLYLTAHSENESKALKEARNLVSEGRYKKALDLFPKKYSHERILLKSLVEHKDFRRAFLSLPSTFQRFVINSYQSYLFNLTLDRIVKAGIFDEKLKIPIIGYDYSKKLYREEVDEIIDDILRQENISPDMFYFKEAPHLTTTTHYRKAYGKVHDFSMVAIEKDEHFNNNKLMLRFSLRKSTYATTFLREIFEYKTAS